MNKIYLALLICCWLTPVWAAEVKLEAPQVDTRLSALQRGAEVMMNACLGCHNLKYIKYRHLDAIGIAAQQIDAWRGQQTPDATLSSLLPAAAAMQAFGMVPVDLSLFTLTREAGEDYVYAYLTAYHLNHHGTISNHLYHETRMPDVLGIASATDAQQRAAIHRQARDVATFLAWAADPHQQQRHRLGYYVIGYLIILTFLLYLLKRRIWSRLK